MEEQAGSRCACNRAKDACAEAQNPGLSRSAIAAEATLTRPCLNPSSREKIAKSCQILVKERVSKAASFRGQTSRGMKSIFSRISRVDSAGRSRLNRRCHGKETEARRVHKGLEARCRRSDNRFYTLLINHHPKYFYRSISQGSWDPGTSVELTGVSGMMRP